jgi:hypothetical protein
MNIQGERVFDETREMDEINELFYEYEHFEQKFLAGASRGKTVKFVEQERRQGIKVSQIMKENERKNREPAVANLGKNAKKTAGRRAVVMALLDNPEVDNESVDEEAVEKSNVKTFGRIKRKQGHRERPVETQHVFDSDDYPYVHTDDDKAEDSNE